MAQSKFEKDREAFYRGLGVDPIPNIKPNEAPNPTPTGAFDDVLDQVKDRNPSVEIHIEGGAGVFGNTNEMPNI